MSQSAINNFKNKPSTLKIIEKLNNDEKIKQIAIDCGVCEGTVYSILKK